MTSYKLFTTCHETHQSLERCKYKVFQISLTKLIGKLDFITKKAYGVN